MSAGLRLQLNRASTAGLLIISAAAWLVVLPLWYGMFTGQVPPPGGDEGTTAHLFQLCIALLLPLGVAFVASVDWSHPAVALKPVALSGVFVVLALGTVFYLENIYYAAHGFPPPRPGLPAVLLRDLLARLH
jgi:hypothetical protein